MKISTTSKINLNFKDLEKFLKKEGYIVKGSIMTSLVVTPSNKELEITYALPNNLLHSKKKINIEDKEQILNSDVTELHLTNRAMNCLKKAGIVTVKELLKYTKEDLLKFRTFGEKSINEVVETLLMYGLNLASE